MSKRGERGILQEARDVRELRDEGRRKIKLHFFLPPPLPLRAKCRFRLACFIKRLLCRLILANASGATLLAME